MKQKTKSKVLLIANLLMLFMLLGTGVYAFVWNNAVDTGIEVEVGVEETLTIITKNISEQNEDLKLIPQNALATHENERKQLVYKVEIALENGLEEEEELVTKQELIAKTEVDPESHLDVKVYIEKEGNTWTATITVKLDKSIDTPDKFEGIKEGPHAIKINFTLTPIPVLTPIQD